MKRYPYTKVHYIRLGEARITFFNGENVLNIKRDILDPLIKEVGVEEYLINYDDIIAIIASNFQNFPRNQKNQLKGSLTINGNYIPENVDTKSKEKGYLQQITTVNENEDCIISGINGKDRLKDRIVTINDKLKVTVSKIRSMLTLIKTTIINEECVEEFNS